MFNRSYDAGLKLNRRKQRAFEQKVAKETKVWERERATFVRVLGSRRADRKIRPKPETDPLRFLCCLLFKKIFCLSTLC